MRSRLVTTLAAAVVLMIFAASPSYARGHHRHGYQPWCGIYMSQHIYGHVVPRLKLARNWATEGSPASGPCIGCLWVKRHHVGLITGRAPNGQWIVLSGNDGGRVRERPRSLAGAIAFRYIGGNAPARMAYAFAPRRHHYHYRFAHHHHRYRLARG